MLVHRRVTPSIEFAGTHISTWIERGTVRVKWLAQKHNTMSPARARSRTARSGVERSNYEASVLSCKCIFPIIAWHRRIVWYFFLYCSRIAIFVMNCFQISTVERLLLQFPSPWPWYHVSMAMCLCLEIVSIHLEYSADKSLLLYTICSLTSAPQVGVHLTVRLGIKYEENHFLSFRL